MLRPARPNSSTTSSPAIFQAINLLHLRCRRLPLGRPPEMFCHLWRCCFSCSRPPELFLPGLLCCQPPGWSPEPLCYRLLCRQPAVLPQELFVNCFLSSGVFCEYSVLGYFMSSNAPCGFFLNFRL